MPRDPKVQLRMKVAASWKNYSCSLDLVESTRAKLDRDIVAAVNGGITRYELAKLFGKSPTFVANTPGLDPNRTIPKVVEKKGVKK